MWDLQENIPITICDFPNEWKQARITPIPKMDSPQDNNDFRPISILPVLSKIYERLVHNQVVEFLENYHLLEDNISGFRKGHSTASVLLSVRDDILKAMNRSECTLLVLADFSKAFDTVKYKAVLEKMNVLGFCKSYLKWTVNYLCGREQFVQIDDRISKSVSISFGVPQGSIMGPLIFNIYIADLQGKLDCACHQYADDTTIYQASKPGELTSCIISVQRNVDKLQCWANEANLVLNPSKTKYMLLSSTKLSSYHELNNIDIDLRVGSISLEHVSSAKLLGTHIDHNLKWEENVKQISASCYRTLGILKKLRNFLPFHIRKQLVQALVLSKLYYNCVVYHNLPHYLVKRLQRIQTASASFVVGKFVESEDIIKLSWLPVKEHIEWQLLKLVHKAIYSREWPGYLRLKQFMHNRTLRSSAAMQLEIPLVSHIYQDQAAKSFNILPGSVRNCLDFNQFSKMTFKFLMRKVKDNLLA